MSPKKQQGYLMPQACRLLKTEHPPVLLYLWQVV